MVQMAKLRNQGSGFTQVKNAVLYDPNLTMKAKGLFAYLSSKPDGWRFRSERIAEDNKDSRDSVRSGIRELEELGYLERNKLGDRTMEYIIHNKPKTEKPSLTETEKARDGKSHSGKIRLTSNTEGDSNTDTDSNTIPKTEVLGVAKDISEVIDLFKKVNPGYRQLFGRPNQRKAVERLLMEWPRPQLDQIITVLEKTNTQKYAPVITTPIQLEEKMGALKAYIQKQRDSGGKGKTIIGL